MPLEKTAHDLLRASIENPFRLFNLNELAQILGVSRYFIAELYDAGSPFPGSVSRPEWVLE